MERAAGTDARRPLPGATHRGFPVLLVALLAVTATVIVNRLDVGRSSAVNTGVAVPRSDTVSGGLAQPGRKAPARGSVKGSAGHAASIRQLIDLGLPVYCGGGEKPLVALTFDDGPGPYTEHALHMLRSAHMTATFFLVGKLIGEPAFAGLPRQEAALGVVGDHTWSHDSLLYVSPARLRSEIARTRRVIQQVSGQRVALFRPPLEQHDPEVDRYVQSIGMLQVLWDIDSRDSQGASADQIVRNIRKNLGAGDIVLLHENRGTTREALSRILDLIRRRGLKTVTVPQLLKLDPPTTEQLRTKSCP